MKTNAASNRRITLERTYRASVEGVWERWTTKDGIESWWAPEGFRVEVVKLELRPGGVLDYLTIADTPEHIELMKQNGLPTAQRAQIRYDEITPLRRLAYTQSVDFVPGVTAYDVGTVVELEPSGDSVRLTLNLDPMHDAVWNELTVTCWTQELGKLEKSLASRK